jgi:septal ring factor EnvC (AmiA/AmiB activator)
MEARDLIVSSVMVVSAFVMVYTLVYNYTPKDPVIVVTSVVFVGMLAILFLSVDERLKKIERDIKRKERSLRVSLQSVEEEVKEQVSNATSKLEDIKEEILVKRRYR